MSGTAGGGSITVPNYNFLSDDPVRSITSTASNLLDMQNKQFQLQGQRAQQAIGGILQQATDANGNVDYSKAQTLASQAGPVAQMGMQKFLESNAQLRSSQLNNAAGIYKLTGMAAMSVAKDGSPANTNASFDSLIASGLPAAEVNKERQRWLAMPDDATRQDEAYRHGLSMLDQLHQVIGQTTGQNIGGQIVPLTVTQPGMRSPGGLSQGGGSVTTTASPDTIVSMPDVVYPATPADVQAGRATSVGQDVRVSGADRTTRFGLGGLLPPGAREVPSAGGGGRPGVVNSDGTPVTVKPPRLLNVPGSPQSNPPAAPAAPAPTAVPAPPGAPAGAPVGPGGIGAVLGGQGATAAPAPMPVPPVPPAVVPPPAATTAPAVVPPPAATGGPLAANPLAGGVPVASANALAPNVGAPSPPSPAVPGYVAAIQQGIANARGAPATGSQMAYNTIALGPGVQDTAEWKASSDRLAADDTMASNFAQTQFPSVQALKEYGKGTVTGANADFFNRIGSYIRTPLQKMGFQMGDLSDANARYDALNKWLSQIVASTPFAAGSDARLSQVLNGSASTHINQSAGEDMLKAGLVLQRMNVAANTQWHAMSPQDQAQYGGLYMNYLRGYANRVDPRAFGVDMYNPEQLSNLRTALKNGGEAAAKRFNDSKAIADGLSAQPALP
jgi:hypothetical protein